MGWKERKRKTKIREVFKKKKPTKKKKKPGGKKV
jgi:hypothetical protein